jgi:glucan biosynthesis protein C
LSLERRYDIDWLRVIAILAVYFHHIGMPFNGDDFHIMNAESSKLLDDIMVYFEQFRLPLLFLVSGTGTVFAFSKRSWFQFLKERNYRLIIPLIFGILFIVPPQTFYEHYSNYSSYIDVYKNLDFEVNHLWFIRNLFIISIAVIPFILFLRSEKSNSFIHFFEKITAKKYGLFLIVILLISIKIITKKINPSDSKDISNISSTAFYGFFFITGILIAASTKIWIHLKNYRKTNFTLLIISSVLFYFYYFFPNRFLTPYFSIETRWNIWYVVCCLVSWLSVITLLGYGQIWLNKKSEILKKCNEAIYPFYVLHQTIIIIFGFYIIDLNINIPLKILLLLFTTFPVIIIIYRFLIYPFKIPRFLFGMKKK